MVSSEDQKFKNFNTIKMRSNPDVYFPLVQFELTSRSNISEILRHMILSRRKLTQKHFSYSNTSNS